MSYLEERRLRKLGLAEPLSFKKKPTPIAKKSTKKLAEEKAEKDSRVGGETELQKWFQARRKELSGFCKCGCNKPSSKNDDKNFRSSIAHIFPRRLFESVQYHKLNWVERNFWFGCHSNMDNQSMDKWVDFADWQDIRNKFFELAPILTDEERASKFYQHFEGLVYKNNY